MRVLLGGARGRVAIAVEELENNALRRSGPDGEVEKHAGAGHHSAGPEVIGNTRAV